MSMTLRALSALLSYPTAELQQHIGEVRTVLHSEGALPRAALARLEPLLAALESEDLLDLQANYCGLFDHNRALSLHLFEHVHGDSRERGQAMIDLGQQYFNHGFAIEGAELPDYLPMFLEFLSWLPPAEARDWLSQPAHVLVVLQQRMVEQDPNYAAIFAALVTLSGAKPDPEAVAALQERSKACESKSVDEDWEETPVDFSAPLQERSGGGVIARIKATREALRSAIRS